MVVNSIQELDKLNGVQPKNNETASEKFPKDDNHVIAQKTIPTKNVLPEPPVNLIAPINHDIPKVIEDSIRMKADKLQPLIEEYKVINGTSLGALASTKTDQTHEL